MKRVTDTDKKLGVVIRNIRKEKGFSQKTLAEKLNISTQQIQKYEVGKDRISASRLKEIEAFLGPIIIEQSNPTYLGLEDFYFNRENLESLSQLFLKFTPEQQKALKKFLESL